MVNSLLHMSLPFAFFFLLLFCSCLCWFDMLPFVLCSEGEFSSTAYHELLGQHAIFAEHTAVSSASHPCPYVAYFGPIHHSSSNSTASVSDGSNFNNHWNTASIPNELPTSYALPGMDVHYHGWDHHSAPFSSTSSRIGGADQPSLPSVAPRAARTSSDISRSGSFIPPFIVGHSSAARAGSSVASSMIPTYPGSAARNRDRMQALQAYSQQPSNSSLRAPVISGSRRSSSHRSVGQVGAVASSSEQPGGFYFLPSSSSGRTYQEPENPLPNRFHSWDRDHLSSFPSSQIDRDMGWGPFHQVAGGSDLRTNSFRQRHGSERMPSHNRS
ncbi:OLC1v1001913C1 [Oldenlandia corymbosa var. corymbosa]|uniref:OLC1v1001913C1 n=1 Tax=Oldenlandia corymbosa var. corymbosa TaxID=529605 RepID=A0AAV1D6E9_OLDCO|nr:OLC1v1001913C1 [Oldenlandia corymbosa var. corymbosa]